VKRCCLRRKRNPPTVSFCSLNLRQNRSRSRQQAWSDRVDNPAAATATPAQRIVPQAGRRPLFGGLFAALRAKSRPLIACDPCQARKVAAKAGYGKIDKGANFRHG
jgi:hypothetical protein